MRANLKAAVVGTELGAKMLHREAGELSRSD